MCARRMGDRWTLSACPSSIRNVTNGWNRDTDRQPLAEEDDWFASSPLEPTEPTEPHAEIAWHDEPDEPRHEAPEGLGRRQAIVVGAVVAAIVIGAAGILLARSLGGSDGTTTPTTTGSTGTVPTTPTKTTPAQTTSTQTTPTQTTPTGTSSVPTDATLKAGVTGAAVTALQQALTTIGYAPGKADGTYGPGTTLAVSAFQKSNGLTADGVAGPTTIAAINAALAKG